MTPRSQQSCSTASSACPICSSPRPAHFKWSANARKHLPKPLPRRSPVPQLPGSPLIKADILQKSLPPSSKRQNVKLCRTALFAPPREHENATAWNEARVLRPVRQPLYHPSEQKHSPGTPGSAALLGTKAGKNAPLLHVGKYAFRPGYNRAREAVSNNVDHGSAHVDERVDAEDEQDGRSGNLHRAGHSKQHYEYCARHSRNALAGEHENGEHCDLARNGKMKPRGLRREQRSHGKVDA